MSPSASSSSSSSYSSSIGLLIFLTLLCSEIHLVGGQNNTRTKKLCKQATEKCAIEVTYISMRNLFSKMVANLCIIILD